MKIPQLRFPEFKANWEKNKLGDIGIFIGGGTPDTTISKFWSGNIPWISSSDIMEDTIQEINISRFITEEAINKSATKIIPTNSVLMVSRVGIGKFAVSKQPLCTSQDFTNLRPKKDNPFFLAYYFKSKTNRFLRFSQGTSIKGFTGADIRNMDFLIPTLPEQQKIASFFTAIDQKITQLKQKKTLLEQYKKGVMQKIFSQEIRFKDDNGQKFPKWEKKKLGDCLEYIQPTKYIVSSTEYDNSYNMPVLTAGKSFILGYTNETEGIFYKDLPVIIFDDFTTATKFVDFPFKVKSSAMKILVTRSDINIRFIYELIQVIKYEIGGHERHWISKFAPMVLAIPSLPEQTKIANFLSAVDDKISHTQKHIDKAENWKKGLMQQMFV